MKGQPRTKVTHFRNSNFKDKTKRLQIPQKLLHEKFYVHEKISCTRNCCRKFIKHLPTEKRKEDMYAKQPLLKLRLKNELIRRYCFTFNY